MVNTTSSIMPEHPIIKRRQQLRLAAWRLLTRGDDGGAPIHRNNVGFSGADYGPARRLHAAMEGRIPADQDVRDLIQIMRKYRRQIEEIGFDFDDLMLAGESLPQDVRDEIERQDRMLANLFEPAGEADEESSEVVSTAPVKEFPPIPPMDSILGVGGVISKTLPRYEAREPQLQLAQAIADAIEAEEHLIGEAGTGTGKSLAYLIPAIYGRRKVLVSTEGKPLQDQLAKKDVPFLKSVLPVPFTFAVLKGIGNYVCKWAWDEEVGKQTLMGEASEFATLRNWLRQTVSGDLAEAPLEPSQELRQAITISRDDCLGRDCPYFDSCFGLNARRRAADADVVIVNHTLLALDLSLRASTDDGVKVLPDRNLIIVDEAHSLNDVATSAFTLEMTNWTVTSMLRGRAAGKAGLEETDVTGARTLSQALFNLLGRDERQTYVVTPNREMRDAAKELARHLNGIATKARQKMPYANQVDRAILERFADRLREKAGLIVDMLSGELTETRVLYVEKTATRRGDTTVALKLAPISVADSLHDALWTRWPVVATSATLTTGQQSFAYIREQIGCNQAREIVVESPFNYRRNALIYLPRDGAVFDPSRYYQTGSVEYFDRLGNEIEQLLLASDGRAFCLFTSRRALNEVYDRIASRLKWNLYRQGDASPQRLIEDFKADGHGVLFGLRSFWAGVDVQGEALSLVIIDKLPFPTPDEPVYHTRCEKLTRDTGDKWAWFNRLAIPLATIQFKQGVGRLIRSASDRGVLALLDGRLVTKGYGTNILRALPPAPQTRELSTVKTFFAASSQQTGKK